MLHLIFGDYQEYNRLRNESATPNPEMAQNTEPPQSEVRETQIWDTPGDNEVQQTTDAMQSLSIDPTEVKVQEVIDDKTEIQEEPPIQKPESSPVETSRAESIVPEPQNSPVP